jgi:rRNA maturation RNase YbeY
MIQRLRRTTKSICDVWVPAEEPDQPLEVSLRLCTDQEIRNLNSEWRGKDQATDVLSFPQFDMPLPSWAPTLGDVVISVDTAARQAEQQGHHLGDELVILLTHGVLHLLGFDDRNATERERMAQAERGILMPRGLDSGLVDRAG